MSLSFKAEKKGKKARKREYYGISPYLPTILEIEVLQLQPRQ